MAPLAWDANQSYYGDADTHGVRIVTSMKGAMPCISLPVKTRIFQAEVALYFDGPDVEVRGNNAKGVFSKGEKRAIFWRNGERFYEAVFARAGAVEKDFKSIAPYLERDVASPEKSKAEIKAWKEAK